MKMRKTIVLVLFLMILIVFTFKIYAQGAEAACGPFPAPEECLDTTNCGAKECTGVYDAIEVPASTKCHADDKLCQAPVVTGSCEFDALYTCTSSSGAFESCDPATCTLECQAPVYSTYGAAVASAKSAGISARVARIAGGQFALGVTPCAEINNCLASVGSGAMKNFEGMSCSKLDQSNIEKILKEYGETNKAEIEKFANLKDANMQKAILSQKYEFQDPGKLAEFIRGCNTICDQTALNDFAAQQSRSVLANQDVRAAMTAAKIELPWWKQVLVTAEVLKNNPYIQAAGVIGGIVGLGKDVFGLFNGNNDKKQDTYNQNNYYGAQSDISAAQNSQGAGTSLWSNCPGHRSSECTGKPICVVDTRDGASQCLAVLPGGGITDVKFGSIYVIDNKQNNMFTLKGTQNEGVVYQKDGYVNIDKGGTTKISVAGQGALITDINNNQLYLGRGTTTYLGIGNEDFDTYLTNTFVLDFGSKVAVNAVNEIEQNRFKNNANQIARQNNELALTINKYNLKPYKNAVDIGNLQWHYQILTRGSSDIMLVEKNKIFPLAARNLAKGDSLIVKNKNVKISNTYVVNDGNYEYTIQTIDDSTRVFTKNKKIIQDSGPLDKKLSERQSLLIYSN